MQIVDAEEIHVLDVQWKERPPSAEIEHWTVDPRHCDLSGDEQADARCARVRSDVCEHWRERARRALRGCSSVDNGRRPATPEACYFLHAASLAAREGSRVGIRREAGRVNRRDRPRTSSASRLCARAGDWSQRA